MASNVLPQKSLLDEVLECSLCLHIYENPNTLQNCLHTFCLACIQEIPKTVDETDPENALNGWKCPVCDIFSSEDLLIPNGFLADLIQKKTMPIGQVKQVCKQCSSNSEAMYRCMDCKLELCDSCRDIHLKIPLLSDHKITNTETHSDKLVTDSLILCPNHDDQKKPVEINCNECQEMICLKCKIADHNTHIMENFDMALEHLVPKLESNTESAEEYLRVLKENIKLVRQEIEETKQTYDKCKVELNKRLEDLINKLTEVKCKREEQLAQMEKEAIEKLENIKLDMEKALRYGENLKQLSKVTRVHAKNITLLHEIQGGLLEKLEQVSQNRPHHETQIEISLPYFQDNWSEADELASLNNMFGKVAAQNRSCFIFDGQETRNGPFICENFLDIIEKKYSVSFSINLPCWCNRISYINEMVWAPLPIINEVRIYNKSGDWVKSLKNFKEPRFVTQIEPEKLIIGGDNGLHISNSNGSIKTQISQIEYADASHKEYNVVALEYDNNEVKVYSVNNNTEKEEKHLEELLSFSVTETSSFKSYDTILVEHNYILITSVEDNSLLKFTKKGKLVKKIENANDLCLSGLDKANNILAAEFSTGKLIILDEDLDMLKGNIQLGEVDDLRDAVVDSDYNIWVLQGNNVEESDFRVTKYVQC